MVRLAVATTNDFVINQYSTYSKFISCYMFQSSWDHHQEEIYEYV
jgi:hypothetical protein